MSDKADKPEPTTQGGNVAERIIAEFFAGIILYGGLGYLAERLLDVPYLFMVGILIGVALSGYLLIKRFGSSE
ncbi:MAG: AtpZ/AtpI family protein [Propionibacteriaceae bacterium]|nr:AtpZ/AtpI family protein [Propionibacteriaceae bacterium]